MIYAATGHRPNKLYLGYENKELSLKILMKLAITYLKEQKDITALMSGMAIGWDTAWALAAVKLNLPLIAAVPFEGQETMWPVDDIIRYKKLLEYAKKTGTMHVVCQGGYDNAKFHRRNEFMVDNSQILVALWDKSDGGTGSCMEYAYKRARTSINLWNEYEILIQEHKKFLLSLPFTATENKVMDQWLV